MFPRKFENTDNQPNRSAIRIVDILLINAATELLNILLAVLFLLADTCPTSGSY